MKAAYPLNPKGASNEKVMEGLFLVLLLYQLPLLMVKKAVFSHFLIVLAVGLFLDTAINFIRHKRPVCAVSAAITAGVVTTLLYQASLPLKILGVTVAIILGKHIWGGTGKNIINPAIAGVFVVCLFQPLAFPMFPFTLLFLPAIALSILFFRSRPFAATAFIVGMVMSLLLTGDFSWEKLITYGVVFFSAVLFTDPTTVTYRPLYGTVFGFLSGLVPLLFSREVIWMCCGIFAANLLSWVVDETQITIRFHRPLRMKKQVVPKQGFIDTPAWKQPDPEEMCSLEATEILDRIKRHKVFGMGGAAFRTDIKIQAVLESDAKKKHLILNGVECDPGLIHDRWLMGHHMSEIEQGTALLKKLIPFTTVTLAVKGEVKNRFGFIKKLFGRTMASAGQTSIRSTLEIYAVPDFYPAGAEKTLIREILHRECSAGVIPAKEGILVLNIQTAIAIYRAVVLNEDITTRVLTAANLQEHTGCVMTVRLGEKVSEALSRSFPHAAVGFTGGGMMQGYLADDDAVITPDVNFIATGLIPKYKESVQCSRCGDCLIHCPAGINVRRVADLVDAGKMDEAKKFRPEECIQCGICSYLCPAGRKLSQRVSRVRLKIV